MDIWRENEAESEGNRKVDGVDGRGMNVSTLEGSEGGVDRFTHNSIRNLEQT